VFQVTIHKVTVLFKRANVTPPLTHEQTHEGVSCACVGDADRVADVMVNHIQVHKKTVTNKTSAASLK